MTSSELSRSALALPPEQRLELARQLVESVVTPANLLEVVQLGVRRIEVVSNGRTAGLSEAEYRTAKR
jgi:hypothetical protein